MTKNQEPEAPSTATSLSTKQSEKNISNIINKNVPNNQPLVDEPEPNQYPTFHFRIKEKKYAMIYIANNPDIHQLKLQHRGMLLKMSTLLDLNQSVCRLKHEPINSKQLYRFLGVGSTTYSDFQSEAEQAGCLRVEKNPGRHFKNEYHIDTKFACFGSAPSEQKKTPFVRLLLKNAPFIHQLSNLEAGFLHLLLSMMHQDLQVLSPQPDETVEWQYAVHSNTSLKSQIQTSLGIKSPKTIDTYLSSLEKKNIIKDVQFEGESIYVINPSLFIRPQKGKGKGTSDAVDLYQSGRFSHSLKKAMH